MGYSVKTLRHYQSNIKKAKLAGFFENYPQEILDEGFGVITLYNNNPEEWINQYNLAYNFDSDS